MEGSRFDTLARSLSGSPSRRGALRLLAGSVLGGLLTVGALPTAAKKKKKVTLCHNGQTIKVSKKAKKTHLKHGDTPGACPTAPPPPCVPEPQATTCAGAPCGKTRINPCGQAVACTCPRGQDCLGNGTCARPCTTDEQCAGCGSSGTQPDPPTCGQPSREGARYCGPDLLGCAGFPACTSTSECPQGQYCRGCGDFFLRCFPVSPCTGNCAGADACQGTPGECPGSGQCFQPLGGGPTRCGVPSTTGSCGCTSHQQCEANHGTGAFCVTFDPSDGACTCAGATTFCATSP